MNTTQLLLLTLNCLSENRDPSHTEQSHIYVFYKTQIEKKMSIDEFMFCLIHSPVFSLIEKKSRVKLLLKHWLNIAEQRSLGGN